MVYYDNDLNRFIDEKIIMKFAIIVNNRLMQVLSVAMSSQIHFSLKSSWAEFTSEWLKSGVFS